MVVKLPWWIWIVLGTARVVCAQEGVVVEVSVLVAGDYNVSNFYDGLVRPRALNISAGLVNSSNATGNTSLPSLNVSNYIATPFSIVVIANSLVRILDVAPILCVIGFDYNCYNDTNVTRILYTAAPPSTGSMPAGYIVGTSVTALVLVTVLAIWFTRGFRQKKQEKQAPDKRPVIPITIDWPPKNLNKKVNPANGMVRDVMYRPGTQAPIQLQIQPLQYIHLPLHPTQAAYTHA